MSIIIKGMEMPEEGEHIVILIKSNGKCSYFRQEDTEYGICGPMQTGTAIQISTPHGRLIDEDEIAFHKHLESVGNGQYEEILVAYEGDIDLASTILEAEE